MATKFIDSTGLSHLISKIKAAIPTKTSQLTNDSGFLTSHQTIKQDGITGATVNRFGTCGTAAATAAKTVNISTGTFSLEAGSIVAVKFSNTNSASSPTLNVNSTGAKNIFVNGAQITTSSGPKGLLKGTVIFIYDGTQYHLIGNYYDSNSNTWRGINVNGTSLLGTGTSTGNVNFKSGTNTTVTGSGTDITFDSVDTVTTASTTGSGNAVTAISATNGALTVTKGSTFLTSHQTIKQDGITGATINRFGTCSTASATAAKTVSITTGTFSLEAGAMVAVKFSNANSAGTPTLNVNSTGAKNIFVNGAQITTGTNLNIIKGTIIFVYDGTQYHVMGNYIDTNTNDHVTQTSINTNSNYPILLKKSANATQETSTVNATNLTSGTAVSINPSTGNINAVKLNGVDIGSSPKFTDTVTTVSTSGSGNAVTAISASNGALTVTKGSTFSLSSHTHNYAGSGSAGGPAINIAYQTTAPTANNDNGLKIAYLTSDPATKYSGWLYLIAE